MSALPSAVKKQIAAAEAAHKQAYSKPDKGKPDEPKPEAGEEEVQPEQGSATQADLKTTPDQQVSTEQVADGGEGAVEPKGKQAPTTPEAPDAWEKRYNILKGKYDAEVPRLAAQLRDQKAEMESLRGLVAKIDQTPAQSDQTAAPRHPDGRLLNAKEIEDYGDELISVIQRGAQEVFNPEVAALKEELATLKQQLGGVDQTLRVNKRETVLETLTREVPEWEVLNEDELFLHWLDQTDPYSGEARQELLNRAFGENNAARVVAFFKGYQNENEAMQPAPASGAPQQRNTPKKLDDMVAPGKPQGASGVAQNGEKRMWTQKQIAQFYQKVNTGKYRNRPKEQLEIEKDIVAAASEGRITS